MELAEKKQNIEQTVLAFLGQARLFAPCGQRVLCAVSGGADSTALLLLLTALAPRLSLTVEAVHVNHGLRGEAADRDEAFVRGLCARLQVPLTVYRAGPDRPADPGEDWARRLRYGFFEQALAGGNAVLATAHTQNDQAETLLFRLARGTGLHGAAGIPARRGQYVRPLLCLTRQDTEAYCAARGTDYVTDATNLDPRYARNRLRLQAVPALEQTNSAAVEHLTAFCRRMQRLDDYFAEKARQLLTAAEAGGAGYDLALLRQADEPVLQAALHALISPVRDAEEKILLLAQETVLRGAGSVSLTDTVCLEAKQGRLLLRTVPGRTGESGGEKTPAPRFLPAPGEYRFPGEPGFAVRVYEEAVKKQILSENVLKNGADYDKIPCGAVLRTRRQGDRFRLPGRGVSKSVKKLMIELGIDPAVRDSLPLLAADEQVLWLWGQGFAHGLRPDGDTKRLLIITPKENPAAEGELSPADCP